MNHFLATDGLVKMGALEGIRWCVTKHSSVYDNLEILHWVWVQSF